jgi:hypothetical protein
MHTETNMREGPKGDEAVQWLWKEWASVLRLRNDGIPTVGFTWYSLTDQIDWDTALREQNGNVNPLGLYDLDRKSGGGGGVQAAHQGLARRAAGLVRLPDGAARAAQPGRPRAGRGCACRRRPSQPARRRHQNANQPEMGP